MTLVNDNLEHINSPPVPMYNCSHALSPPYATPPRKRSYPSTALPLPMGELGESALAAASLLSKTSWPQFICAQRVSSLQPDVHHLPHLVAPFLQRLGHTGVPGTFTTPPWSPTQLDEAVRQGSHSSATKEYREYLEGEMGTMVRQGYWAVLPYTTVRHLPGLKLSPAGVVPQRDRRPRPIIDYTWSGINQATNPVAPFAAMQFGNTLQRVLQQIAYANPAFGPVLALKCDLADGFYRIPLASSVIPHLGVIMPYSPGEEPLIAFPLALPMGWTHSPPFFSAYTETIADVTNDSLTHNSNALLGPHRLDHRVPTTYPHRASVISPAFCPPFNPQPPPTPLATVDVYVDDFIGLAQAPTASRVKGTLLSTVDRVFRPPTTDDDPLYKDPISLSKLDKGDLEWGTKKRILGWDIDTAAGTILLPEHRQLRLHELLNTFSGLHRTSRKRWYQLLGELRSMSLAIPGSHHMFSILQNVLVSQPHATRLRLSPLVHATLKDWLVLASTLSQRPTPITHLVPTAPTYVGTTDASKQGMGGVWFPTSLAHGPTHPLIWRSRFAPSIQKDLVSSQNPQGSLTNSDLELLGVATGIVGLAHHRPLSNATLWVGCDNTPAVAWCGKGSTSASNASAFILRHLGLVCRDAQMKTRVISVPGESNTIADFLSRSFHLSDDDIMAHLHRLAPTQPSFQWLPIGPETQSQLTSALLRTMLPMESLLSGRPVPTPSGTSGSPSVPPSMPPYTSMELSIPSLPSCSSPTVSVMDKFLPVELLSALEQWKTPFVPWARRWPSWGRRIPV